MIYAALKYIILSANIYSGICFNRLLLSDDNDTSVSWSGIAASAGLAFILCFYQNETLLHFLPAAAVLISITAISKLYCQPDFKLLLFTTCSYLGLVYLMDTVICLFLDRFLAVPQVLWLTVLALYRIPLYIVIFTSSRLLCTLNKCLPYYRSIYGTSFVGFLGIVFLARLSLPPREVHSLPTLWLVLLTFLILRINLAYSHIKYLREKELLSTIELQKALLEKNYAAVNRSYTLNARLFHDFHRHLEVICQMAMRTRNQELIRYIEAISSPLKDIAGIVWTGDETVDYILNSRYSKAKEEGIAMELNIEFPCNTSIRSNDMCTILSNLLDNALEATSSPDLPGSRFIYLAVRRIHNILVIKLENSSLPPIPGTDGRLQTTKENPAFHGWGMKNIESAVHRYDGVIQTSYADHRFQTIITMSFDGVEMGLSH